MADAKICDKCGAIIKLTEEWRNRRYVVRDQVEGLRHNDYYIDLCPECYAELVMFLEEDNK